MNILSTDQENYNFLNVCNLCRYARFSQAQSQLRTAFTTLFHLMHQLTGNDRSTLNKYFIRFYLEFEYLGDKVL